MNKKTSKKILNNHSKLKILILTWEFPPNVVGGLSRHVFGLSAQLSQIGVEVHVLTAGKKELPFYEKRDNIHVHRVIPINEQDDQFLTWIGGLNLALALRAIEIAEKVKFDLVHAHDWLVGAAGIALKESLSIPLLTTIHATEHGRNNGIHNELQSFIHEKEEQLIKQSDQIIVCSEFMRDEIKAIFNVHEEKIVIIPNGIEVEEVSIALEKILPVKLGKTVIFSVGRIVEEKGFETMIEAASIVKNDGLNFYFVVAGKGPMLESYRQKIRKLELEEQISFIGYITDEQKKSYIMQSDVTVFPSLYEPFGIVALESMILGKPTIVSNTGGLKGIVHHLKSGLLMNPGDSQNLLKQLKYLLDNPIMAEEIGLKGKEMAKALYGWKRIATETKLIIVDMLLNKQIYCGGNERCGKWNHQIKYKRCLR